MLIVLGLIGVLSGFILFAINPFTQLNKAKDAQRQSDIKQLVSSMDTYYNDNNCYPTLAGDALTNSGNPLVPAYIKQIPTDPDGNNYYYFEDPNSCPQWNVVFTRLSVIPRNFTPCPLPKIGESQGASCTPENFDPDRDFCVVSGEVSCSYMALQTLPSSAFPPSGASPTTNPGSGPTSPPTTPTNSPSPTQSPNPTPTSTPMPTPTLPPYSCVNQVFAYPLGSSNCNVISPITQCDFAGGSLRCYQNRSGTTCLEPVCTSYSSGGP